MAPRTVSQPSSRTRSESSAESSSSVTAHFLIATEKGRQRLVPAPIGSYSLLRVLSLRPFRLYDLYMP